MTHSREWFRGCHSGEVVTEVVTRKAVVCDYDVNHDTSPSKSSCVRLGTHKEKDVIDVMVVTP